MTQSTVPVRVDGSPLTIEMLVGVARGMAVVEVGPGAEERMRPSMESVQRLRDSDAAVYGVTTGFGALADTAIDPADRVTLQRAIVLSHSAGMGPPVDDEVVRGMTLLRARSLSAGYSGVRVALVEAMVRMLNAQVRPYVPEHGSLGASGDLAPLAHVAACLLGEGWVVGDDGRPAAAAPALAAAGLTSPSLEAKEGLALINGTDGMAATLALAVHDLEALLVIVDGTAAMSIEALLGTPAVFDEELIALRPAAGQAASAANIRGLLEGSRIVDSHRHSHHAVQDAYSLRCTPQVHGAARDVVAFARQTVERELAAVVDNPVVLAGSDRVLSSGNFHGQALAYAADMCASVCADLAAIAERRVDRLLDPSRSRGLPGFLTEVPGVNSGLMIAQYTAAAIVASLRAAATPLAAQSMSTSAGQEDHVSMGWTAAQRTRRSVTDLRRVIAIEATCAAQALDLRGSLDPAAPLSPGRGTGALRDSLREHVAHLDGDRFLAPDLAAAEVWLASGLWRAAVHDAVGSLL
ncbi:MAG: histidine ammonia-lyase [Candidatus Dormibacteria bacterium]